MPDTKPREEPPRDPSLDHGWAWVIAAAVCTINIISLGSIRCLGILVNNASIEFSLNKRDSSIIFSVTYTTFMLSSILFIGLSRVISCRILIFVGGILMACGLLLPFFLPRPSALAAGTAVLLGLGLSASQNPSVLLLNQYFDRYRSRANGIAFAGGPIGSLLVPPLLNYLMIQYAFRGAMLLWSGFVLHVCAVACVMRPKPPLMPTPMPMPPAPSTSTSTFTSPSATDGRAYGASLNSLLVPYAEEDAETLADDNLEETETAELAASAGLPVAAQNMDDAGVAERSKKSPVCGLVSRVLRRPLFYVLSLVVTLGLCGLTLSFYIVPLHGREIGLDSTTTSLFLLLQGIPDLLARLLAGFITDKRLLTRLRLVWLCLALQSGLWFLLLATPSYGGLLFFAAGCGLFGGVLMAEAHPLAISQMGLANYPVVFSAYSILLGVWMLGLPILLGHIYDRTNTWRPAIAFVGCLLAIAGFTGLLLDLYQSSGKIAHRVVARMWRQRGKS